MEEWSRKLCRGLYELQQSQKLCDTVMESVQESQHVLHSCVLATASQRFARLDGDPPFLVKCEQISQQSIDVLIELLYTGELRDVTMSQEVLKEVWEGAESLCIPHINSYVEKLLPESTHMNTWISDVDVSSDKVKTEDPESMVICDEETITESLGDALLDNITDHNSQPYTDIIDKFSSSVDSADSYHRNLTVDNGVAVDCNSGLGKHDGTKKDDDMILKEEANISDAHCLELHTGTMINESEMATGVSVGGVPADLDHSVLLSSGFLADEGNMSEINQQGSNSAVLIGTEDRDQPSTKSSPVANGDNVNSYFLEMHTDNSSDGLVYIKTYKGKEMSGDNDQSRSVIVPTSIKQDDHHAVPTSETFNSDFAVTSTRNAVSSKKLLLMPVMDTDDVVSMPDQSDTITGGSGGGLVAPTVTTNEDTNCLPLTHVTSQRKVREDSSHVSGSEGGLQEEPVSLDQKCSSLIPECQGSDREEICSDAWGQSIGQGSLRTLRKFDPRVIQFLKKQKKTEKNRQSVVCEENPKRKTGENKSRKTVKVRAEKVAHKTDESSSSLSWSELKCYVKKEEKLTGGTNAQYQCSLCGIHKSGYENFLGHKLRHASVVPFHCKHCGKGFYRKTDGQRHEQRAMCKNRCSYSVVQSNGDGALKVSKFINSQECMKRDGKKWYKCCVCNKLMVGYETFLAHKFDHTGIKPFACKFCEQAFSRKTEWRKHVTNYHPDYGSVSSQEVKDNIIAVESADKLPDDFVEGNTSQCRGNAEVLHYDIGEENKERLRQALRVLEEASHDVLMENLAQAEATRKALIADDSSSGGVLIGLPGEADKVVKEDNEMVYQCSTCSETFTQSNLYALHTLKHSQPRPYTCEHCPETFHRKWDLNAHTLAIHAIQSDEQFTCESCSKTYMSRAHYRNHFKKSTGCVMSEGTKVMLDEEQSEDNVCNLCGNKYSSPFYLEIHKKSHEGRNYVCDVCGQTFLLHSNLVVHMKRHLGQKQFGCGVCGKRFVRNCEMQQHLRSHSEQDLVHCEVCGKVFKHSNSLHLHMKLHAKVKQYLCDLCGKAFSQKGNLKKHKKETHASQYNYECGECDKKFYTEGGLIAHKKTKHSSLRPFACKICFKTFAVRINLTRHLAMHTDEKPFSCPQCNKTFRLLAHLRRHLVSVHNISHSDGMAMHLVEGTDPQETLLDNAGNEEVLQTEYVFVCQDESIKQEDHGSGLSLGNSIAEVPSVVVMAGEDGVATVTAPQLIVLDKDGVPVELPAGFVVESKPVYTEGHAEGESMESQVYYYTELNDV